MAPTCSTSRPATTRPLNVGNRPIIAVQLPTPGRGPDHRRSASTFRLRSAIHYILDRARRLSPQRPLPVVINISFGYIAGPHDGSGLLERFMDA